MKGLTSGLVWLRGHEFLVTFFLAHTVAVLASWVSSLCTVCTCSLACLSWPLGSLRYVQSIHAVLFVVT